MQLPPRATKATSILSIFRFCINVSTKRRLRSDELYPGSNATDNKLLAEDIAPTIEVEITDYGLRIYTLRGAGRDKRYLRVTNFVHAQCVSPSGGSSVDYGYSIHWHVPIDDTSHWKYIFAFSREKPLDDFMRTRSRAELTADYRLTRNASNRYQQRPRLDEHADFHRHGFELSGARRFRYREPGPGARPHGGASGDFGQSNRRRAQIAVERDEETQSKAATRNT